MASDAFRGAAESCTDQSYDYKAVPVECSSVLRAKTPSLSAKKAYYGNIISGGGKGQTYLHTNHGFGDSFQDTKLVICPTDRGRVAYGHARVYILEVVEHLTLLEKRHHFGASL